MKKLILFLLPAVALQFTANGCSDSSGPGDYGSSIVSFYHVNPYRASTPITFYREGDEEIGTAGGYEQSFSKEVPNGIDIPYQARGPQNDTLHSNGGTHEKGENAMVVFTSSFNPDGTADDILFVVSTKETQVGQGNVAVRFINAGHKAGRRELRIQEQDGNPVAEVDYGSANGAYVSVPDTVEQFWVTNKSGADPIRVPVNLTSRASYTILFHGSQELEAQGRGWKGTVIEELP